MQDHPHPKNTMCAVIVAEMPSQLEAKRAAEKMKDCPHLVASGIDSCTYISVFLVPKEMDWWVELPCKSPNIMGALAVQSFKTDDLIYPQNIRPRFAEEKSEKTPCGSDCQECTLREQYSCPCCPATVHQRA